MIPRSNVMSLLYQPKEHPFGHTWQYWTTKWWQWFLSIPAIKNPATHINDINAYMKQFDSNVCFLASTTGGRVDRKVKVPLGKAVLFPVINVTISNSEDPSLNSDTEMISFVESHMDDIVKKQAKIDGMDLLISEKFRVQSP